MATINPSRKKTGPSRPHDRSRRQLFTHRRMLEDLLRDFVKLPWVEDLDFSTLKKLSTDYVTDGLDERLGDVVWEVRRSEGQPVYILVLIEFQSSCDPLMPLRMIGYVVLFHQRLAKERPLKNGEKLPPVLPILLYSGEEEYTPALEMLDLIAAVPPGLEACQPNMRYHLVDELRWPCSAFVGVKNALAAFLRLEQSDPEAIRELVLEEGALDWLEKENPDLLRDLLDWVSLVLLPRRQPDTPIPKLKTLDELKTYMEKDMETWSEMLVAKGRGEGETEGRVKEARQAIVLVLNARFGSTPPEILSKLESIDELTRLHEILEHALGIRSIDELDVDR